MSTPGEPPPDRVTTAPDGALDYPTYLHLGDLLSLQHPRSSPAEHDELLFIVVHQTSELWFRALLHELDKVKSDLSDDHLFRVMSAFRRCHSILRVLIEQLDVLETMTPLSFHRFRDRLETSSGFQSMQFRELEFLLGYKRPEVLALYPSTLFGWDLAHRRLHERSVPDHLYDFLEARGVPIPEELRERPSTEAHRPDERVQDGIFELYVSGGEYRILFELMCDFDAALQEWRYRHVKIVERTIGAKMGTGGSLGVAFLKESLFSAVFPDLWAIRHRF